METQVIDPKRQAILDRMAKARAARGKKVKRGLKTLKLEIEKEKKAKAEVKAAKKIEPNIFAGIHHQPYGCPSACTPDCCVITGDNICQHPDIGGLQAYYLTKDKVEVQTRFKAAGMYLREMDTEKAKKGG